MNRILNRHPFLWDTGTLYKKTILQDPHINPFLKEIFDMWYIYADNFIPKSTIYILNEPIWYNNKLTNKFPFIPGWAKHNVLKMKDLLNINGYSILIILRLNVIFWALSWTIIEYLPVYHRNGRQ